MPAGIPALIAGITTYTPTAYRIVALPKTHYTYILGARLHSFILRANEWSPLCIALHAHFPAQKAIKHWCRQCSEHRVLGCEWECQLFPVDFHTDNYYWICWCSHIIVNCVCNTISVENAIVRGMWTNTRFRLHEKSGSMTHQSRCANDVNILRSLFVGDAYFHLFHRIQMFRNCDDMFEELKTSIFGIPFNRFLVRWQRWINFRRRPAEIATMAATNARKQKLD